jgi:hypothetical protein
MASDILEQILSELSSEEKLLAELRDGLEHKFGGGDHDHDHDHHHHHHHHHPPCFLTGTSIATPSGETKVEELRRGDVVSTAGGETRQVLWIGRRKVSSEFADASRVFPVRIRAGALAEHIPTRDLVVSPDHAIMVEGVLIQAGALVNGVSIVRESAMPSEFVYYHVELDRHDLIIADGTLAETFVDNVDRMGFDNWDEHQKLYPEGNPIVELPYPRAKAHRQVPIAVRETLAARAMALYSTVTSSAA